jgi:pheromone shutdown protein TraB
MIILIGTGHVFDLSSSLLQIFDEKNPDLICVELDKQRFNAIMMKRTKPESYKAATKDLPIVYKLLARFQESLASEYGVSAGDEMLTAATYGQSHQLPVEFIDMNAQRLFREMWKSMPFLEKFRLLLTGFGGLFVSKKRVEEELKNFQNDFDTYLNRIGKKFPTIKKTLIDKRDKFMVKKLVELCEQYKTIIACIGDGHVPGISQLLKEKDVEFETIRLAELQAQKDTDSSSGQFSVNYKPI